MVETGKFIFCCDDCPLCKGFEHRQQRAIDEDCEVQFDHCSCDEVGGAFYAGGYCEDAFRLASKKQKTECHKRGRAYRRNQNRKKDAVLKRILEYGSGCKPHTGYMAREYDAESGEWIAKGYIQYFSHSRRQHYYKRYSNKKIRCTSTTLKGNQYRKCFDYRWEIY